VVFKICQEGIAFVFCTTASPDLSQGAAADPDQGLDRGALVHRESIVDDMQLPEDGGGALASSPTTMALPSQRASAWQVGHAQALTLTSTPQTPSLRPCPTQDFWHYGCAVHNCAITAQIREDVHYCQLQSWRGTA